MKVLGSKSASSVLQAVLSLAWYLGLVLFALLLLYQLYLLLAGPEMFGNTMSLQIETPGLVYRFTDGLPEPLSQTLFVLQFTLVLPLLAIGLVVIYQLRIIFASLVGETPFTGENVRRIRIIGIAVIAGALLSSIAHALIGIYLAANIQVPGLELNANLKPDFGGIFLGAVVIVLAEVFRHGARLQEDQDMTV